MELFLAKKENVAENESVMQYSEWLDRAGAQAVMFDERG